MKYLSADPSIMGGSLVIKGTRIPIEVILYRVADGLSLREIHELYPTPTVATLKGALKEAVALLAPKLHDQQVLQTSGQTDGDAGRPSWRSRVASHAGEPLRSSVGAVGYERPGQAFAIDREVDRVANVPESRDLFLSVERRAPSDPAGLPTASGVR